MPLYEYICNACEAPFTLLQSVHAEASEAACLGCGSDAVDKQFSAFSPSMGATRSISPAPCGSPSGGCGRGGCGL